MTKLITGFIGGVLLVGTSWAQRRADLEGRDGGLAHLDNMFRAQGLRMPRGPVFSRSEAAVSYALELTPEGPSGFDNDTGRTANHWTATLRGKRYLPPSALGRYVPLRVFPTELLVVGIDSHGSVVSWAVVPDTRTVRCDLPSANGQFSAVVIDKPSFNIDVVLPDDPTIAGLRVFKANATPGAGLMEVASFKEN